MKGVEQIPWLYDLYMGFIDRLGFGRWRRWLVGGVRGRTLEVGCGTGRNLPLYRNGRRVVGLERELSLLGAARSKATAAQLVVGRVEELPFAAGCFETVISSLVFCSVERPEAGLREVVRVLAPDGHLRMLEHVRSTSPTVARLQDAAQPLWTLASGGCHPNRDTEGAVRSAGLVIDAESRRARGTMRRFVARRRGDAHQLMR